jgi:hypothetical protein
MKRWIERQKNVIDFTLSSLFRRKGKNAALILVYTLVVFLIAFTVGTIRVTLVTPRLGALVAVILEAPIVLAASWSVSRWCIRRFQLSRDSGVRVMMGAVAFSALMLLELGVSAFVFGETLDHYIAKNATIPGAIGLAMQVCFATIPRIQSALRY